jgi:hypothetical protein
MAFHALKLINAAQLNSVAPVVQRLASSGQGREQVVERRLTALARLPSPAEAKLMADFLERAGREAGAGIRAVLWTLINSAEFVSSH